MSQLEHTVLIIIKDEPRTMILKIENSILYYKHYYHKRIFLYMSRRLFMHYRLYSINKIYKYSLFCMENDNFVYYSKDDDLNRLNDEYKYKLYAVAKETYNNGVKRTTITISEQQNDGSVIYCATKIKPNSIKDYFPIKNELGFSMISPLVKREAEPIKKFKKTTQMNIMSFLKKK